MKNHFTGRWKGRKEVFFSDSPEADIKSETELAASFVAGDFLQFSYEWNHEGEMKYGLVLVGREPENGTATGAWMDSWHQRQQVMALSGTIVSTGDIDLRGVYPAPPGPDWGWRIVISGETENALQISMYNITPGGAELLGVRAVYERAV